MELLCSSSSDSYASHSTMPSGSGRTWMRRPRSYAALYSWETNEVSLHTKSSPWRPCQTFPSSQLFQSYLLRRSASVSFSRRTAMYFSLTSPVQNLSLLRQPISTIRSGVWTRHRFILLLRLCHIHLCYGTNKSYLVPDVATVCSLPEVA